jgi:hypothetical protein
MTSFNAYMRIVERAIDDSSDLGSRVSAEVDAAVMASTPKDAARHAKKAVRILQRNGRYAAKADTALVGMATKHQEVVDENLDLFNRNNNLQNENSGLLKRIFNWKVTAGILGVTTVAAMAIGYFSRPANTYSAPAPVVRTVEETKTALPAAVENKDLYSIETLTDGTQRLKVLGLSHESYFTIPDGAKETLVGYISKVENHLAKNGKLENGVHFYPAELEKSLKELYSQDGKSNYGDKGKLVKQDIEAASKELGE